MADRYSVSLTGAGPHHSAQDTDVEKLLASFVAQLRAAGHSDVRCLLTVNAQEQRVEPLPSRPVHLADLAVIVDTKPSK